MFHILENVVSDISRQIKIPLSWWGKSNVISMNITPQFIYVLRGIPMLIPNKKNI